MLSHSLVLDMPLLSGAPLGGGAGLALIASVSALECEANLAICFVDLGCWLYNF